MGRVSVQTLNYVVQMLTRYITTSPKEVAQHCVPNNLYLQLTFEEDGP